MTSTATIKLKCSHMSFTELQALQTLTNHYYLKSISETASQEDLDGLREEIENFNAIMDDIIGERVTQFLPQLLDN